MLTGQSTGNARIRYILIRAHKTLSRMLCCPGECSEQGTLTNSRSVSPLHHCEKKEIYEVKLYGCYILELLAHSQMRMLAQIARFPERNFLRPSIMDVFMVNFHKKVKTYSFFEDSEMNKKKDV